MLRQLLRTLLTVFILTGFFIVPAMAQTAGEPTSEIKIDKKKLLVQPRNADGSLVMVSFWEDPVLWVREKQQEFYGSMSGALRNIRTGNTNGRRLDFDAAELRLRHFPRGRAGPWQDGDLRLAARHGK